MLAYVELDARLQIDLVDPTLIIRQLGHNSFGHICSGVLEIQSPKTV